MGDLLQKSDPAPPPQKKSQLEDEMGQRGYVADLRE